MPFAAQLTSPCEAVLAPRLEQRILPGLDRMLAALEGLGHPERGLASVLVVGTNGKGSTAALLASILEAHGLSVGLFTSPHLIRVEERIRVGGHPVDSGRLLELVGALTPFPELSYFETLTTAAILEFRRRKVDVAVLEAGLGGRWDATNSFPPAVSLLTNVGTDHASWLGSTRAAIAAEKAAALRGREAIVSAWDDEVEEAIRREATAPLTLADEWASVRADEAPPTGDGEMETAGRTVLFSVAGTEGRARLPLAGDHQRANLTLALAGAAALGRHGIVPSLDGEAVARGIERTRWPGRLDMRRFRGRRVLLDGAHNLEAVASLAAHLRRCGPPSPDLLFSCLSDKPLREMAELLRPLVSEVTVAPLDSPRATPLDQLADAFPHCRRAPTAAAALARLPAGSTTLVTGSLRLVGEVMRAMEVDGE